MSIGTQNAAISGTVNPHGGDVSNVHVPVRDDHRVRQLDRDRLGGNGTADVPVTAGLSGLLANTVYHYRIVAVNPGGMSTGLDQQFTTEPVPGPGPQGPPGTQGTPGTPGTNGTSGTPGVNGAQGSAGTNGASGAPGSSGGVQGTQILSNGSRLALLRLDGPNVFLPHSGPLAGILRVQVYCKRHGGNAPCAGVLKIRTIHPVRLGRTRARVTIGSAGFELAPGKIGFVRVPVPPIQQGLVNGLRHVAVTATATVIDASGSRQIISRTLQLLSR